VDVGYYALAAQTTLELGSSSVSSYASLTTLSISQLEAFQLFPLRISKSVLQTVLVSKRVDVFCTGKNIVVKIACFSSKVVL
jgi:hypothetical protein